MSAASWKTWRDRSDWKRRPSDSRDYNRTHRQHLFDQNRCTHCGEKLPGTGYKFLTCPTCREYYRERSARLLAERKKNLPEKDREALQSPLDTTPGCPICSLRGDHVCLKGSALNRREWL